MIWKTGTREHRLGDKTLVMGILNVTPDSFSDGGLHDDTPSAIRQGKRMAEQGADILDVGGESTRPGSAPVSAEEEMSRVIPVIRNLRKQLPDILLSVDTSKASVARAALHAGADIVNDVSAGGDPDMFSLAAESGCGLVLMHMQGTPATMQKDPRYKHVCAEVRDFFQQRCDAAVRAGVNKACIALDPGIGFGKTLEHNVELMANLEFFADCQRPLLLGVSRKRWIGEMTGQPVENRLAGSLAGAAVCVQHGAHIIRVHDVIDTCDVVRILDRVRHISKRSHE